MQKLSSLEVKDPENFEKVKELITKLGIFECDRYTDSFLERRIEVRLRANEMDSFSGYIDLLEKNKDEREKLNKELTIHVTNFFRDASMWQFFRKEVIPNLLRGKKKGDTIKIWSAGCSSGEEPVSIAICFLEELGNDLGGFKVRILGTDVEPNTIGKAKNGLYEEQQFKEMVSSLKEKYFERRGEDYKVKKNPLDLIEYRVQDIFLNDKPKNQDIIFCRNTVIYFSLDAKSKLYLEFFDCLNHNGFFIMGKTEVLQGKAREMFQIFDNQERVYVKE